MLPALRTRTFAALLALALVLGTATFVHAQTSPFNAGGLFGSIGQNEDQSLARSITCGVFGILNNLGVMRSGCNGGTTPPPPPPPGPGPTPTPPPPGPTPPPPAPGTLRVIKNVQGGTSTPAMFTLRVQSNATSTLDVFFPGSATGSDFSIGSGASYNVTELSAPNYTASFSSQCSGTMPASGSRTCTVTNTFNGSTSTPQASSTLTIIKNVSGGTASSSAFLIHLHKMVSTSTVAVAGSPQMGSASGTAYMNLGSGTYHVTETGGPSNYALTYGGDCDSSGHVTLTGASTTRSCTLTNTFTGTTTPTTTPMAMLTVNKVVSGSATSSSAFQIHVKNATSSMDVGGSPSAGSATGTSYMLPFGSYVVSETGGAGFSLAFSGDCNSSGMVTLSSTSSKTCTLTNTATTSTTTLTTLNRGADGADGQNGSDGQQAAASNSDIWSWIAQMLNGSRSR